MRASRRSLRTAQGPEPCAGPCAQHTTLSMLAYLPGARAHPDRKCEQKLQQQHVEEREMRGHLSLSPSVTVAMACVSPLPRTSKCQRLKARAQAQPASCAQAPASKLRTGPSQQLAHSKLFTGPASGAAVMSWL